MIALDNGDKIRGDAAVVNKVDYLLFGFVSTVITQLADGQLPAAIGDLYTAGANGIGVSSIVLVNTDTVARVVNLYLTPNAGAARRLIPKDYSLLPGHSLHTDGKNVVVFPDPPDLGDKTSLLLKTGQTTQYESELDDGYYEVGEGKAYTIWAAGQYGGTSNIDLVHKTAATIAFAATTPGTITDSGNDLAMFKTGETIVISGSANNDGVYVVSTGGVAGTIRTVEATLLEAAGAVVSIAKREAHSNNCIEDDKTTLMWSRYSSAQGATMGTAGTGKMPWSGELYDIFQYIAAANAANLGGYDDWRVPNVTELSSLVDWEQPSGVPDAAAFLSWAADWHWTSTTRPDHTPHKLAVHFLWGENGMGNIADPFFCALVRAG